MTTARQAYLDRVRGLAVLIMIEAHVLDSWTRAADRARAGFGYCPGPRRFRSSALGGGSNPIDLLKVDILNVMGPAIALTALAGSWTRTRNRRVILFAVLAAAIRC